MIDRMNLFYPTLPLFYPHKTPMGLSLRKGAAVLPLARHTSGGFCVFSRRDLRVPVRVSPGAAQYESELSWIRQIRQELGQMEAARQWAKS